MLCRLILAVALLPAALVAQVRPVPDGDLYFHVIPAKTTLHSNETLLLKVEVTNVGNDPILVRADDLCLNPGAGLALSVADSSAKDIKISVPLSCAPNPASNGDGFVRITPDAFYGRVLRLEVDKICQKPGVYDLTFTFHGTLSRKAAAQILPHSKAVVFTSDATPLKDTIRITAAGDSTP